MPPNPFDDDSSLGDVLRGLYTLPLVSWQDDQADEEWVEDGGDPDEEVLLQCPSCGEQVHEDTQQCPYCRDWITPVDRSDSSRRMIWIIVSILLIIVFSGLLLLT